MWYDVLGIITAGLLVFGQLPASRCTLRYRMYSTHSTARHPLENCLSKISASHLTKPAAHLNCRLVDCGAWVFSFYFQILSVRSFILVCAFLDINSVIVLLKLVLLLCLSGGYKRLLEQQQQRETKNEKVVL
ncbi:hypothetical protein BDZ91DRAFT_711917 [Kalaharituber pfeilii]|nr:hypothetical protein BDZ91DRAFT_711917 [Kalaharituber pfeilii]